MSSLASVSSSPGRLPPISRPDWPWAARSYSSQRSQQNSPHPVQGSNLQSGWDPRASISSSSSQSSVSGSNQVPGRYTATPKSSMNSAAVAFTPSESTRQWTFTVCFAFLNTRVSDHTPVTGIRMDSARCSQASEFRGRCRLRACRGGWSPFDG